MASVQIQKPAEETSLQEHHQASLAQTHTHDEHSKSQGQDKGHQMAKSLTQPCQSQTHGNQEHHRESSVMACPAKSEKKIKDKKEKKEKKEKKDKKEKKEKKEKKSEGKKKEKRGHKKKEDSSSSDSD
ncbi:hypothetical protein P3X46_030150 [Hevea brasiliensis]|nr:hypothetical protein P3X46_030150 [Hevea brasiliensis]